MSMCDKVCVGVRQKHVCFFQKVVSHRVCPGRTFSPTYIRCLLMSIQTCHPPRSPSYLKRQENQKKGNSTRPSQVIDRWSPCMSKLECNKGPCFRKETCPPTQNQHVLPDGVFLAFSVFFSPCRRVFRVLRAFLCHTYIMTCHVCTNLCPGNGSKKNGENSNLLWQRVSFFTSQPLLLRTLK